MADTIKAAICGLCCEIKPAADFPENGALCAPCVVEYHEIMAGQAALEAELAEEPEPLVEDEAPVGARRWVCVCGETHSVRQSYREAHPDWAGPPAEAVSDSDDAEVEILF